jgi:hypothetical protein
MVVPIIEAASTRRAELPVAGAATWAAVVVVDMVLSGRTNLIDSPDGLPHKADGAVGDQRFGHADEEESVSAPRWCTARYGAAQTF